MVPDAALIRGPVDLTVDVFVDEKETEAVPEAETNEVEPKLVPVKLHEETVSCPAEMLTNDAEAAAELNLHDLTVHVEPVTDKKMLVEDPKTNVIVSSVNGELATVIVPEVRLKVAVEVELLTVKSLDIVIAEESSALSRMVINWELSA